MTLREALENYRTERIRTAGGPHPQPGCQCAYCDVVRAADVLYELVRLDQKRRRWRKPVDSSP